MNIVSLNSSDLGGLSYNLCHAINLHTTHKATNCVMSRPFTRKPIMVHARKTKVLVMKRLIDNADVIHFNEFYRLVKDYKINPKQCRDKKIIFHAHGTRFRRFSRGIIRPYRRAFPQMKVIVGTPDLLTLAPKSATWFPSVVPVNRYRKKYNIQRNSPPLVYYSPTGSSTKVMRKVIRRTQDQLRRKGVNFRIQVTTDTLHTKNLAKKSKADIYYDEIAPSPFYGINAIEAAGFELAVICNMTDFAKQYMIDKEYKCPFIVTGTEKGLKRALTKLVKNRAYRQKLGKAGYEYVNKMHTEKICVKRFLKLVE
jgi:glycosyltransferase involved in cell wall biosynthesis